MAIVKACNAVVSIKNSGHECSKALGAMKMIIAAPTTRKWTANEIANFPATIDTDMHAASSRAFAYFGNKAPIDEIVDNDADDVIQTFESGKQVFVRAGFANRVYSTTEGGLCYASELRSLLNSGYGFVPVDEEGQFAVQANTDGTFSPFPAFMGGKTPKEATFKTVYVNRFMISYDPTNYINSGEIYSGGEALLDFMGLLDVELSTTGVAASSTTHLKFKIFTECAGTDLSAIMGASLANFTINRTDDNSVPTTTAIAVSAGVVDITGTFTTGKSYKVALVSAATLKAAGIEGYEMVSDGFATVVVP
jgi:hypothetical protein